MKTTVLYAIMSFGFGVLAAPAPAAGPVAAAAQALEVRVGEYLGGLNMDIACREQYGAHFYARSSGGSCNDWSCTKGEGHYSVDTPRACHIQHGGNTYAWCTSGVNGWGCYKL
jgi:hypothetical protein